MDSHHWEVDHPLPSRKQRIREAHKDGATGDLFTAPATNSPTSQQAAREIDTRALSKRRLAVYNTVAAAGADGLARFQIARRIGVEVHWISSSVDALLRLGEIAELDRKVLNPESNKNCAVLVAARYAPKPQATEYAA